MEEVSRSRPLGRVTIEPREGQSSPVPEADAGIERSRYTWWPDSSVAGALPEGFRLDMICLTTRDGARRFAAADETDTFLLLASLGGQAVLERINELDAGQRSSYNAMRLIFQHARLPREYLARTFKRKGDLLITAAARGGQGWADILPDRIGMGREDHSGRWTVSELLRCGRVRSVAAGDAAPSEDRCIAAGLTEAARRDPLDRESLSEAEALGLVRMALFDAGPVRVVDGDLELALTEELLAAIGQHGEDDAGAFQSWFFGGRDNLIRRLSRKKVLGKRTPCDVVRQVLLKLIFDSHSYVGDCVSLQMQAFLRALPARLSPEDEATFKAIYYKQPHLGGLPLVLLRDRFPFLREAILDIMEEPDDAARVGVLLRLMQFYEEMTGKRRDADRAYKKRRIHRDRSGKVARTFDLNRDISDDPVSSRNPILDRIADVLRRRQHISCGCIEGEIWITRSVLDDEDRDVVELEVECPGCGRSARIKSTRDEIKKIGPMSGDIG